ncbi:hypothetical protein [Pseudorhodobacter aquimaris]|uniref:hypothetical protein n=1 Tax=Pseudorhodobacter aquimaris TaxID=687412 RepID=UPI0012EE3A9E|nr:hypothetical protein [Pseudorhodobacter aquimaris]
MASTPVQPLPPSCVADRKGVARIFKSLPPNDPTNAICNGLITINGHGDSSQDRLEHKEDGYCYNANYPLATILAPRYLLCTVRGRVQSNGNAYTPMNGKDVREACE